MCGYIPNGWFALTGCHDATSILILTIVSWSVEMAFRRQLMGWSNSRPSAKYNTHSSTKWFVSLTSRCTLQKQKLSACNTTSGS